VDGLEYDEEFGFDDVVDIDFNQIFKLPIIWPFQYVKTTNIQRLDDIWGVYKEVENNNIFFCKILWIE